MADPLTSDDIIRENLGFGPSTPDERQRAFAAGISPLGTMERGRLERGGGISSMASKEEKEAWVAAEVMAGQRDPMELPKAYGGIGERPEATTRRGFRMQQEWDKQYEMMVNQQEATRQAEERDREYALRLQEQQNQMEDRNIARDTALAKSAREAKIRDESRNIREAFIGATLPNGGKTNPIDLNSDDAVERIQSTIYMNDFGMEDQATKEMVSTFLNDALRIREKKTTEIAEQAMAETTARVGLAKDLASNGLSIAEFSEKGKVDFEKANIALGEALKKKEEGKETTIDEREQRRTLRRQKAATETELVKVKAQIGRFEKLRPTADNIKELEAARVSQGIFEDDINRINRELGEEAQAATTPTGQRPTARDIFGD
jgi:hypothetical protein